MHSKKGGQGYGYEDWDSFDKRLQVSFEANSKWLSLYRYVILVSIFREKVRFNEDLEFKALIEGSKVWLFSYDFFLHKYADYCNIIFTFNHQ